MTEKSDFSRSAPYWLRRAGVVSWLFLGVILAAAVIFSGLSVISGITIPLLIAVVIGIIFRPLVDVLARRRVPRSLGTLVTMGVVLLGVIGLMAVSRPTGTTWKPDFCAGPGNTGPKLLPNKPRLSLAALTRLIGPPFVGMSGYWPPPSNRRCPAITVRSGKN